ADRREGGSPLGRRADRVQVARPGRRGSRRRRARLCGGPGRGCRDDRTVLIPIEEIRAARERLAGRIVRTPLVRLELPDQPGAVYLKLENLQPNGPVKPR